MVIIIYVLVSMKMFILWYSDNFNKLIDLHFMFFVGLIILQFPITDNILGHLVKNVTQNLQISKLKINNK